MKKLRSLVAVALVACMIAALSVCLVLLDPAPVYAQQEQDEGEDEAEPETEDDRQQDAQPETGATDADKYLYWYETDAPTLREIVVTAERSETDLSDLPRAAGVVTGRQIRERLSRTAPEALREQAGVLVQRTNQGGGSPFIRGLTGYQVLILVDGIRLNNAAFRSGPNQYLNTIDPMIVDRIEVVRGPGSVLYGSDALGGVINVITKRREVYDNAFGLESAMTGRASTAEREETFSDYLSFNASRHVGFAGTATWRSFGDIDGGGDLEYQDPSGYDQQDYAANLDFVMGKKNRLQFTYQHSLAFDVPNYDPDNPLNRFDPQRRDLGYARFVSRDLTAAFPEIELTLSLHNQEEGRDRIKVSEPWVLVSDLDRVLTTHAGLKIRSRVSGFLDLVYGGEYYQDRIASERRLIDRYAGSEQEGTPQYPDDSAFTSAAAYLEARIEPFYWARLVPGIRWSSFRAEADLEDPELGGEKIDTDLSELTWAVHTIFDLSQHNHLILGVARGFRAPSINDLTKFGFEDGRYDVPNPDLDPEFTTNYEAGYRLSMDRARISVFYYYTELEDLIAREPSTYGGQSEIEGFPVNTNRNVGEATIWGIEGDVSLLLPPNWMLNFAASYTYGQNEDDDEPLRRIPPFLGNFGIRFTSDNEDFWIEPYMLFAAEQERLSPGDKSDARIPEGGTPGFVTYNLRAGFQFTQYLCFVLAGENLTDEKYKYHGSGIYEPGRNFKGQMEFRFDF